MLTFGFRGLFSVCLKTELFKNCQYVHKKQRSSAIYLHVLSRSLLSSAVPQSRLRRLHLDGRFYERSYLEHSWTFISVVTTWNYTRGHKSRDKFAIVGLFSIHTYLTPPPPHKQRWSLGSRIFPEFQHCIGWGEGKLQAIFEKDALFYKGAEKFRENYEYCITFPRTFVQDCS